MIRHATRAAAPLPCALACAIVIATASAPRAAAQGSVLLQGVADAELWSTTGTSNLLTRNSGRGASLIRLQAWGAYEPTRRLVFYAQGEMESGSAAAQSGSEVYTNQFGVRFVASPAFVVDAGRLTPIIGTFSSRHFSTRNPLIGEPDGYANDYPTGAKVSGEYAHFDYRAGVLSLPAVHIGYEPRPSPRWRPAVGAGFTPVVGLRIGGSATVGSYLDDATPTAALAGQPWSDYHQRVVALDLAFARGYLETHVEAARGAYDVPGQAAELAGFTYYGEAKYTFTPRLFAAVRLERNKYPFIRQTGSGWTTRLTDFVDGESGLGYRLTSGTLLKASYRVDRWWVREGAVGFRGQGGHAFAMQLSQTFDAMDWIDRARLR